MATSSRMSLFTAFILLWGTAIFLPGCTEEPTEVQTETVFRDKIVQTVTGNGKIYPVTEVNISARVQGQITKLDINEGDSVKAGQVLLHLEQEQYRAALERARSSQQEAQATVTLAKNALKRTNDLFDENLISASDLESAQAEYDRATSRLKQAVASVKETNDALARTVISSPIDGIVIQKNKEVGEIALGSQFQEDVIMVVAQLSEMEVRIDVNENDIVEVEEGDTTSVEIDAFPDTTFLAMVSDISNSAQVAGAGTIEEVTNFEVKVRLIEKLPKFRPGMSATADIATESRNDVINVPIQSVTVRDRQEANSITEKKSGERERAARANEEDVEEESVASPKKKTRKNDPLMEVVFVIKDGVVQMREVKLGISDDGYYEVLSGLNEGDEVVTGPYDVLSRTLADGQDVRVNNKRKSRQGD